MIRKIHLDFHTHPDTKGIGKGFDPERFARTLAAAGVNYLATPGKCHFGHCYYQSEVAHSHPHLADPDMFPETVAACNRHGIQVQAYWTLGLDAYMAEKRPEWRQIFADGTHASWGHYLHMCYASPYIDEIVIPEIEEVVARCPGLAGFWFDICLYVDGAFYSSSFQDAVSERLKNPAADDNQRWQLGRALIRERCVQLDGVIKALLPNADNYFNSLVNPGENGNIGIETYEEVENPILFGGPEKMTSDIRWLRNQVGAKQTIGLVSRFQGPWSDPGTIRTQDQICFDIARTVALGSHVSMGDHRYPDGSLEPEVYRRLAPLYKRIEAYASLLDHAEPCREAVLLGEVEKGSGKGLIIPKLTALTRHAARILEELGIQFDVITPQDAIPHVPLLIWLGEEAAEPELLSKIEGYLRGGGRILAFDSAIDGAEDLLAVSVERTQDMHENAGTAPATTGCGHVELPDAADEGACPCGDFYRSIPDLGGTSFAQLISFPARIINNRQDITVLAHRYAAVSKMPPFPSQQPGAPAIAMNRSGTVIYSAVSLFREMQQNGSAVPAETIELLCNKLLEKRLVQHDAGQTVAAHLHRTEGGFLIHLVHWALDRWDEKVNAARDFPLLGPITVTVNVGQVDQVVLKPGTVELAFEQTDVGCSFTVPSLHVWQMVYIRL